MMDKGPGQSNWRQVIRGPLLLPISLTLAALIAWAIWTALVTLSPQLPEALLRDLLLSLQLTCH